MTAPLYVFPATLPLRGSGEQVLAPFFSRDKLVPGKAVPVRILPGFRDSHIPSKTCDKLAGLVVQTIFLIDEEFWDGVARYSGGTQTALLRARLALAEGTRLAYVAAVYEALLEGGFPDSAEGLRILDPPLGQYDMIDFPPGTWESV